MPPWTPEEEELLRRLYPTAESAKLEEVFRRKLSAITYKANSLNLKRERYWKGEEVKILSDLYPTTNTEKLAKLLGRSTYSIRNKAARLGLGKLNRSAPKRWTEAEINLLEELYPTRVTKDLTAIFNRTPGAIRAKAWDLKIRKKKMGK